MISSRTFHDNTGEETWGSFTNGYADDGSLARQTIVNRDGSTIRSEFAAPDCGAGWEECHVIRLADGSTRTFENAGNVQTINDADGNVISKTMKTADGLKRLPIDESGSVGEAIPVMSKTMEAAVALMNWMSSGSHAADGPPE